MILSPSELESLTGFARRSAQVRWLRRHGWRFIVNGAGMPVVAKAEYDRIAATKYVAPVVLPLPIISALHAAPFGPGVYFLWNAGDLVYVGQSTRVRTRLGEHREAGRIPFTDATFVAVPEQCSREDLEAAYIRAYRPPYNRKIP